MDVYLKKKGIPPQEHSQEVMSRLIRKARDVVKVTLRSIPSLKSACQQDNIFFNAPSRFLQHLTSDWRKSDGLLDLPEQGSGCG